MHPSRMAALLPPLSDLRLSTWSLSAGYGDCAIDMRRTAAPDATELHSRFGLGQLCKRESPHPLLHDRISTARSRSDLCRTLLRPRPGSSTTPRRPSRSRSRSIPIAITASTWWTSWSRVSPLETIQPSNFPCSIPRTKSRIPLLFACARAVAFRPTEWLRLVMHDVT